MSTSAALPDAARLLADLIAGVFPDARGRFGPFGGRYVPETLIPGLERLERGVREHLHEPGFQAQFTAQLTSWVGRPTALTFAARLSARWGAQLWLKREDLAHTGAHKINNAIGQALLAQRLGAKRIVAETGAGQHGVASAAACARLGLPCTVYMGSIDMERQAPNVGRMRLLGAEVVPVTTGDRTLRAAIDEALRAWTDRFADYIATKRRMGNALRSAAAGDSPLFSHDDVHGEQSRRGRIDRHRSRDLVEGDSLEESVHVFDAVYRNASSSDFTERARRIRVEAHLRRKIECDGESRLTGR